MSTTSTILQATREESLRSPERAALFLCLGSAALAMALPLAAFKVILGAVLALGFITLSWKYFYLGVALFTFLLPLQNILPGGSILITGFNLQSLFVLYFLFLAFKKPAEAERQEQRHPALLPLFLLFSLILFSALRSVFFHDMNAWELLAKVKNWFAYSVFAWLCFKYVREPREKKIVTIFILLVVMLNVAVSLRNVLGDLAAGSDVIRNRAVSLVEFQPNLYGGFLALNIFLFLAVLVHYPLSLGKRLALLAATLLVGVNLVYTMSRGAWLACGLAILVVAALKTRKLILPLLAVLTPLLLWMPKVAEQRWQSAFESERYSIQHLTGESRRAASEAALRIIQWRSFPDFLGEDPLLGIGFERYPEEFHRRGYYWEPRSAHSTLIEIGVEEGLLGLALYFWLLLAIYKRAGRLYRSSSIPIDRVLCLAVVGATVCLLLLDLTGTRFRNSNVTAFYWILVGMAFNSKSDEPGSPEAEADDQLEATAGSEERRSLKS